MLEVVINFGAVFTLRQVSTQYVIKIELLESVEQAHIVLFHRITASIFVESTQIIFEHIFAQVFAFEK